MKTPFRIHFADIIVVLFASLFLYTAVSKILDYRSFYATLDVLPSFNGKAFVLAPLIVISEISISCVLMIPATRIAGLYLSFTLMCAFTLYLLWAVYNGKTLPCSCGGAFRQLSWKQHLVLNIFVLFLSVSGILIKPRQKYLLQ